MKRFLSTVLTAVMVFLAVFVVLPAEEAQAADWQFPLPTSGAPYKVTVLNKYSNGTEHSSYIHEWVLGGSSAPNDAVVDIAASAQTPIYAVDDGTVYINKKSTNSGWHVVLKHSDGSYSYYGHLYEQSPIAKGSKVTAGQQIGKVGMTGAATGYHLHFEWSKHDPYCLFKNAGYVVMHSNSGASAYPHTHTSGGGTSGGGLACSCSTAYAGSYKVKGTSGGLAISSGHGSSTAAGNSQLGLIPEGATVSISKATGYNGRGSSSGHYGHVTYNGITGYCAMNFLEKVATTSCNCSTTYAGWYQQNGASDGLAISSGHGASTASGNKELGLIPKGAYVYITKASGYNGRGSSSGQYGSMTYNGISGHCAMNLLDKVASYKITLNANGGSVPRTSVTVWANLTDNYELTMNMPTRSGYIFQGWYTAASGGTQVYNARGYCTNEGTYWKSNKYVKGANVTLYAQWVKDTVYASSVSLNSTAQTLTLGDAVTLTATVLPSDTTNKTVEWTTDDSAIAVVENGTVRTVGVGRTFIRATTTDGTAKSASCEITVLPVYVSSVALQPTEVTVFAGNSASVSATVLPANATNSALIWSSADETVATVSDGTITGVSAGTTTITAAATDGSGASASCTVTVTPAVDSFELKVHSITLADSGLGSSCRIGYTVSPAEMADKIVWTINNPDYAAVSSDGLVTAFAEGRALVTASIPYGPSDSCIVKVESGLPLVTTPDDLTAVEAEAFLGSGVVRVQLNDLCASIGERAFAECGDLLCILIPDSVTDIAENAFEGSEDVVIVCGRGSEAERFAIENSIDYVIDETASFVSIRTLSLPGSMTVELEVPTQVKPSVYPANASNQALNWVSDDETVVTVTPEGVVTGLNPGTATITASTVDGSGLTASCSVTVVLPEVDVTAQVNEELQTIGGDNAYLAAELILSGAEASRVQQAGVMLYDADMNRLFSRLDVPVVNGSVLSCRFDLRNDFDFALTPETTYHYRYAVVVSGIAFYSDTLSFTTEALPPRITLNPAEITLLPGDSQIINALVQYTDETDLIWRSSNSSVVSVLDGEVMAINPGTATITALLAADTSVKATCRVTVESDEPEEIDYSISLSDTVLSLTRGTSALLTAEVRPASAAALSWSSSNSSVAAVSGGLLTAAAPGSATITVSAGELGLSASCTVEVVPVTVHTVSLNTGKLSLVTGNKSTLSAEVLPEDADNRSVVWKSSNTSVATVSGGTVTAVAAGTAVITATAADGSGSYDSCTVTVSAPAAPPAETSCSCSTSYSGYYVVSTRTNGDSLAISSGHGASTASGNTELGEIPMGTQVYISKASGPYKTSGKWGHVTYNGVTGYCSMYYLDPVTTSEPASCTCSTSYAGKYVVTRTGGDSLAISSGHGASTASGNTKLGEIPMGTEVYISAASGSHGTSGKWGHVTYNGVSGYCSMYYLEPSIGTVDTSASNVNQAKLQKTLARANAWVDYRWVCNVDIPVYNNEYETNGTQYWYKAGTTMHGIPYTLASSKYTVSSYPNLSDAKKSAARTFTYSGVTMWGPSYGGDCSCLVNDAFWAGDPTITHNGQTWFTSTNAHLYDKISWANVAPGDGLAITGHTMIVIGVSGNNVTIIESRGNGSKAGAIRCQNKTARAAGGYYVCGTCSYCNGANQCGAVRRTTTKSALQNSGYTVYRYKMLYTD